jgi:hypothetical protein
MLLCVDSQQKEAGTAGEFEIQSERREFSHY